MANPKSSAALSPDEIVLMIESIAQDHLFIETLETRHSDRLDFHDVSVWGVKEALQAAFDAGMRAAGGTSKQAARRAPRTISVGKSKSSAAALQV